MVNRTKELSDEDMRDLIRQGMTRNRLEKEFKWELKDLPEHNKRKLLRMVKDNESGKLKVLCNEDDRRRILKLEIKVMQDAGWTEKEIEEELAANPPKFVR